MIGPLVTVIILVMMKGLQALIGQLGMPFGNATERPLVVMR